MSKKRKIYNQKSLHRSTIEKKLRILYYAFMNLLLLLVLFQTIGELGVNYAETSRRLTIYKRMEPHVFSKEIDQLFAFFLPFLLIILQFLTNKKPVDNKFLILSSSLLLSSGFILRFLNLSILSLFTVILSTFLYLKINNRFKEYAVYTIAFLTVLEMSSLIRWLTYPFIKTDFYKDFSWIPSKIDKYLSDFFNTILGPFLVTILIFSWIISLTVKLGSRIQTIKFRRYGISFILKKNAEETKVDDLFKDQRFKSSFLNMKLALSVSLILLFYLTYYSYIPSINPTGTLTNVDTVHYSMFLEKFESLGLNTEGINYLLKNAGNRPVVILTLFFIRNLFGLNPLETVKLSYFIAGFLLVLSTYYSIRIATGNETLSVTSIYFTTFSIMTVVGLYAGYLGNWMAASFLILMASFFSKAVRDKSLVNLVPATVFSALALYSHPWSWFIFVPASLLLLPLNIFLKHLKVQKKTYDKQQAGIIVIFALINMFLDFSKQFILGYTGGIASDYAIVQRSGLYNIFMYNRNLDFMLKIFVGGFTNNYVIFTLSIMGIISILKYNNQFLNLLLMLPLVTSPVFIVSDHVIQSRIIYFLPLHIFSTMGFLEILSKLKNQFNIRIFFILTVLLLANYSFRSVANFI